jgi:hypothetical protein
MNVWWKVVQQNSRVTLVDTNIWLTSITSLDLFASMSKSIMPLRSKGNVRKLNILQTLNPLPNSQGRILAAKFEASKPRLQQILHLQNQPLV